MLGEKCRNRGGSMLDESDILQRHVSSLERRVVLLAVCCAALTTCLFLFSTRGAVKADVQAGMLTVKRLAVVDDKGTERVVIAAPLPDPTIRGARVKRDGPVSGMLIFDPKGNERGGYVTSDTGDLAAFITLDSEQDQVFTAYANADRGATVWVSNDQHDAVAFSTHKQPVLEIVQDKKIIYKQPPSALDLH
jgi:hypothetical protein